MEPASVEQELKSLRSVLGRPVTRESLSHWIEGSAIRQEFLADTLWGAIRWRKSIGRPLVPTLATAFIIEHVSWQCVHTYHPEGGPQYVDVLYPHREPSKWDGPDDDDYHRVSFMTQTVQGKNRIKVDFAANVGWQHGIERQITERGYRDIDPPARDFNKSERGYVVEPFEVVIRPY
jgi:hypothetical protein